MPAAKTGAKPMQANCHQSGGTARCRNVIFEGGLFAGRGEALVITGPNGAGKSTLLRVLAGLLALIRAILCFTAIRYGSAGIGARPLSWPSQRHEAGARVSENLEFWKRFQAAKPAKVFPSTQPIEAVGLTGVAHLPFGYLSAGQQRRIALARLLVSRVRCGCLTSPRRRSTSARTSFLPIWCAHLAKGGMAIAATHQPLGLENVQTLELSGVHGAASEGRGWA
jgi:heme exporter protein A